MEYLLTFEKFSSKNYFTSFPYSVKTSKMQVILDDEKAEEESKKKDDAQNDKQDDTIDE